LTIDIGDRLQIAWQNTSLLASLNRNGEPVTDFDLIFMNHSPRFYVSGHCWTGGAVIGAKISGISADFKQTLLPFRASNRQLDLSCSIEIECPEVTKRAAAQ
jgi:hypothetical protein